MPACVRIALFAAMLPFITAAPHARAQIYTQPDYNAAPEPALAPSGVPTARTNAPVPQTGRDEPVVLEASDMGYDQKNGIVVARGDVEVVQGNYVLRADQLTYYQNAGIIRAQGNVSVLQPTGDVMFADEVELTEDLKAGVIQQFSARLSDDSRFAAREALRENAYRTKLSKAVYSPCNICKGQAPFWQLRADKVDIDEFNEKVTYNDAWMEMMGVPVFYTPRLSHPTPDADAKSGFLVPQYGTSSQFGLTVKAPYYWRISPDKQATITPWYTAEDGPVLETEYEQLTDGGSHNIQFSATYPERRDNNGNTINGNDFRGHIFAKGSHALDNTWSAGYDINRTTDDTYLRRYSFGSQRTLYSRAYVEGVEGRNYATVHGLAIQGLRVFDDPDTTPLIVPIVEGYYETTPNSFGLKYFTGANAQMLSRDVGTDQNRLSGTLGASVPFVSNGGHVFTATASMRTDVYNYDDVTIPGKAGLQSGDETRVVPIAALEWRYPLMRRMSESSITIEPTVLAVASRSGGNPPEITNEDSRVVELTDTNIFSIERFPGLDAIDSGSRVAYGLRAQYLSDESDALELLFGQSYNADSDTPFPNSNEQGENLSDYIGRVAYSSDNYRVAYRFGLDRENFQPNRNELSTQLFYQGWGLGLGYLKLVDNAFLGDSEQIAANVNFPIYEGLRGSVGMNRDIEIEQMLNQSAMLTYENECFNLSLIALRSFIRDRDIEPDTSFTLRVGFKNLGEVGGN